MKYPTIDFQVISNRVDEFLANGNWSIDADLVWVGDGEPFDPDVLAKSLTLASSRSIESLTKAGLKTDQIEGVFSVQLASDLMTTPIEVLDDSGFWRYLALAHFWDFIAWRESGSLARGNIDTYIDGKRSSECVLTRSFIRGRLMLDAGTPELASTIPEATDFWRSHIIRVKTGTAPTLTAAFAKYQSNKKLKTDSLRQLAKLINRLWTNVDMSLYSDEEAEVLLSSLSSSL